jgi:hypothetical protein
VKIWKSGKPITPKHIVLGHHEAEAEQYEYDGTDAEVHQVFHDDVARVFRAGKPVSTIAKPPCIKNTSAAPIRNQTGNTTPFTASRISVMWNTSLAKKNNQEGAAWFTDSALA